MLVPRDAQAPRRDFPVERRTFLLERTLLIPTNGAGKSAVRRAWAVLKSHDRTASVGSDIAKLQRCPDQVVSTPQIHQFVLITLERHRGATPFGLRKGTHNLRML